MSTLRANAITRVTRRRVRRVATLAGVLCLGPGALAACGSVSSSASDGDGDYTVRWSEQWDDTFPIVVADKAMAAAITKATDGHIKFKFYLNSSLGAIDAQMKSLQNGSIQFVSAGSAHLNTVAPSTNAIYLPFLFDSSEQAIKAMEGAAGAEFQKQANSNGVQILTWYDGGFNQICNNVRPIKTPEDAEHLTLRTQPGPIFDMQYKAMGMNAEPIDWNELYTALQNKTVDGYDVPLTATISVNLPEVTKYCSMTSDAWGPSNALVSKQFLDSLPQKYQAIVLEAAQDAQTSEVQAFAASDAAAMTKVKEDGVMVNDVPQSTIDAWRDRMQPVYEYAEKQYGASLISSLQSP